MRVEQALFCLFLTGRRCPFQRAISAVKNGSISPQRWHWMRPVPKLSL